MDILQDRNGLLPKKGMKSRSVSEDWESFYINMEIPYSYSIICQLNSIETIDELCSQIDLSLEEANEYINCLRNIGLIETYEGGFRPTENKYFHREVQGFSIEKRRKENIHRLIQFAGLHKNADTFIDEFLIDNCSPETAVKFQKKFLSVYKELRQEIENTPLNKRTEVVAATSVCIRKKGKY